MAGVKQAAAQPEAAAAPENPFGDGAGQLMLTAPYDAKGLAAELAALPKAATALRAPAQPEQPVSASNPAWLAYTGDGVTEAAVRRVIAAHDPASSADASRKIRGSDVAQGLADLKERLSAGDVLDAIETSKAFALLLGVSYPGPAPAVQKQ